MASLASGEPSSYQLLGARIVVLGRVFSPIPRIAFLRRWQRLQAELRPDIIHAFGIGGTSTLSLLLGRRFKAPVVISLLGGELVRLPQIGYGGLSGPQDAPMPTWPGVGLRP